MFVNPSKRASVLSRYLSVTLSPGVTLAFAATVWPIRSEKERFIPKPLQKSKLYYRSRASGAAIIVIYPVRLANGSSPFAVFIKKCLSFWSDLDETRNLSLWEHSPQLYCVIFGKRHL